MGNAAGAAATLPVVGPSAPPTDPDNATPSLTPISEPFSVSDVRSMLFLVVRELGICAIPEVAALLPSPPMCRAASSRAGVVRALGLVTCIAA